MEARGTGYILPKPCFDTLSHALVLDVWVKYTGLIFLLWGLVVVVDCEDEMHRAVKRLCMLLVSSVVHRIFVYGEQHLKRF